MIATAEFCFWEKARKIEKIEMIIKATYSILLPFCERITQLWTYHTILDVSHIFPKDKASLTRLFYNIQIGLSE
jgi:hypothetical protein